jgi:thioredoxin reductase (NADPH)
MHDVIVIGVGPAGASAAVYAARARLKTLAVGDPQKCRLARAHSIENYVGFPEGIAGADLVSLGIQQAKRFGTEVIQDEVVGIKLEDTFVVELAGGGRYPGAAIVLATGTSSKSTGIANEEQLTGRGVSYCVTCDAFFFRDKKVMVIGQANFAAKETLELLAFTKDVILCSNGTSFEVSEPLLSELRAKGVTFETYELAEFLGTDRFEGVRLKTEEVVPVDGVFIALGTASSLDFARTLGVEIEGSNIVIDRDGRTNFPGIFAAGDCTGGALQVAKAVGDGCVAGLSAVAYVRERRKAAQL